MMMLTAQNEAGHTCPVSMTFSAVAALRAEPGLAGEWEPRILSSSYDPKFAPAAEKSGVLLGMCMTEKQGGSDVRANITRAERIGNSREYLVTGHKWFCSAPMCDAFLILAQTAKGALLLSTAALDTRRRTQSFLHPEIERQAGQPLQCVRRG